MKKLIKTATNSHGLKVKSTVKAGGGGVLLLLLSLVGTAAFAQQPLATPMAYTTPDPLVGPDANQLWLITSNGTRNRVSPQILLGGIPALTASLGRPAWSKDGRLIAADAILGGGDPPYGMGLATPSNVLVVFDPRTGLGNVVFDTKSGTGPVAMIWFDKAFSPDGKRLVYASNQLDYIEYGVVNVDGTGRIILGYEDLTSNVAGYGLDWSPRTDQLGDFGNQLVISLSHTIASEPNCAGAPRNFAILYLVDKVVRLLTQPRQPPCSILDGTPHIDDLYPAFSPDGTQVAFVRSLSNSNGGILASQIMTINIDGSNERKVLSLPGERVTSLSWSPDGSRLVFDRTQMLYHGLIPNALGIWMTSSNGAGAPAQFLQPPAFAPAW